MADRLSRVSHSFLSPETVKCMGVLAMRKARKETQAQYQAGLLAIAQMVKEEEQLRPLLNRKPTSHTRIPTLPWLGVGFDKLDCDTTTRTPRPEYQPCLPMSTDSKDVQVTWEVETSEKPLVMSTVVVDGKGLGDKQQEKKLRFQSRKRRRKEKQQAEVREKVQDTTFSDPRLPSFAITPQPATESFIAPRPESLELPREQSLVLRKLFTRPNQVVQHATLTLRIPSVRRSKTAFSVSRILKHPSRPLPKPKLAISALPAPAVPPPPPCLSELLTRPKVARSHSLPLYDIQSKNCLPHRLTVEYNLFRRVKKANQAKLRELRGML